MPFNFEQLANTATGGIIGLALADYNDQRQYDQQQRLQALQIAGQKDMTRFQMQQQLDMWNKTNYGAQVEHLKKAGLNPALLYGKGGAGGATTGSATGSVQGANAPTGGREIQDLMQMGLQTQMMQAQIELAKTQAEKNKAEATKISGVDTEATTAQTALLAQELDNKREDFQIKRLQQTMMNIENFEKQATQEDRIDYIEYQTKLAIKQVQALQNQISVSGATIQEQIRIIQKTAIQAGLQNELTQAQTGKTKSDIRVNDQQINNFIQQNMREWDKMSQTNKEIAIKQMLGEYQTDPVNTHNITKLLDQIFIITKGK